MKKLALIFRQNKTTVVALRFLSIFIQLFYIKIYTHFLSASSLGLYFYLSTVSYFINATIFVPIDYYQQAHMPADKSVPLPLHRILSLNMRALALSCSAIGCIFVYSLFDDNISIFEINLVFMLSVFTYFCTSVRALLNNRSRSIFVVWMLMLEATLKCLFFSGFVYTGGTSADSLILSNVFALVVEFGVILYFLFRRELFEFQRESAVSVRELIAFCYPVSISALCNWVQLQGYRLVYVWFGHADTAGLYAAVSNIGSVGMAAVGQIYAQLFQPRLYKTRGWFIKSYVLLAACIAALVLLGSYLFGSIVVGLLTKAEFASFYKIMLFGVLVEASNMIIGGVTAFSGIIKKTRVLIPSNLLGVCVAVIGMAASLRLDAPNPYLTGASISASQIVTLLFLLSFVRRSFKMGWVPPSL